MASQNNKFRGMDLTSPLNRIKPSFVALAVNCRAYFVGGFQLRNLLTNAILVVSGVVNTLSRLNDSTPAGPVSGFSVVVAAGTSLFSDNTLVGTGFSGNPVSMIPFRPNTSVQPWLYVGDSAPQGAVTLLTKSLFSGAAVDFVTNGLVKVRSDGLAYKTGVKEPQLAPEVGTENGNADHSGNLLATAIPWTNFAGANPDFDYGETHGFPNVTPPVDGTPPFEVNVQDANFVTINSITGTATINGGSKTPTSLGPSTSVSTNPGHYIQISGTGGTPATATVVTGAFIDASGNVMPIGVAPLFIPSVVDVGAAIGITNGIKVPTGAVSFQIGINSTGNTFSSNSGLFAINLTVTTESLPSVLSIIGSMTLPFWQDSPTSGPVAAYIWKNPGDPGGGTARTISNAIGTVSGNSTIFDANFVDGVPQQETGIGNQGTPMQWFQLNADESVSGSIPVSPTQNANFNFCLYGKIYVPEAGNYKFVLSAKDAFMWGIQGATLVSVDGFVGTDIELSQFGQTMTVVNGYPLLPSIRELSGEDGFIAQIQVTLNFAAAGIYGIEIDYDYWFHTGRILLLTGSPTPGASPAIIPPTSASVRESVQYRYTYRSSATGATSNPSPESSAISLPVTSNTVTSMWSNDPQIDLVDYYRLDSATSAFTYVATGPNDDLGGGGTNTPITDALTDLELGNQLLNFDNFEPVPSIDLPQKGTCTVSGGVITWVSGGSIGGTQTGFNTRWLAGTNIVIGTPTGLAYTLIARPTSTTTMVIPGVPDEGAPVQYTIPEPNLAAQPLPYWFGPTDNINYAFAVGDPLRPGTLYWCSGSNLDAAPDTNQLDVTDPSEPLVNGVMSGGRGVLASIKRFWLIVPNFYNAQATATGTQGSTWSLEETSITRGLFIARCIAVSGGGNIFLRVDDGIHISAGGSASKSITDETLYPLFPHENSTPEPVIRNGITIYPPDDSQPNKQKFSFINGYLYWDYVGTDGNYHTLVFDEAAMGWIFDIYSVAVTARASNEDVSVQGVLAGCIDGTVRQLSNTDTATESATATVLSGAKGGKGYQHCGSLVLEYSSMLPVTLTSVAADEGNGSYGFEEITLPATNGEISKYFVRPTANKWKLLQIQFVSEDPAMQIYTEGCICYLKDWGAKNLYRPVQIFGDKGGIG